MILIIDEKLFLLLFTAAVDNPVVGALMVTLTNWSSKVFAVIYFLGIGFLLWERSNRIIPFILGPALALLAVQLTKYIFFRPRPFMNFEIESLIQHAANSSLPSMHTVSAFVIAMSLWCLNKRIGKYTLLFAGVTGLSRVMVGVHYPLDIILGAILGIIFGDGAFWLLAGNERKKKFVNY